MHGSLHAILETQSAGASPAITGQTVARLIGDGLKRHAAMHMVMRVLAGQLASLAQDKPFDHGVWERALGRLKAADAVSDALRYSQLEQGTEDPSDGPPMNRAQRRAAKRGKSTK